MSPANFATGTAGILSSWELNRLAAAAQGTYGWSVQSGAVTFSSGYIFNVAATAIGDNTVNGVVSTAAYAGGTVTLTNADPTNPRVDVVVITSGGAVSVLAGTPAALTTTAGPVPPTPSAAQLEIARIFVPANNTPAMSATSITDKRATLITTPVAFDLIRTQFRANRRLVAEWAAAGMGAPGTGGPQGTGLGMIGVDASDILGVLTGEPIQRMSVATAGTANIQSGVPTTNTPRAVLSPARSPRMLARVLWPAASANLTRILLGFYDSDSATANGAYIRLLTTGDAFFVTRQGGAETTFDMGVLSRVAVLGYEIESADAGVTWVLRNAAGTVLATQTTNVPTAATALAYGVIGTTATGPVVWGASYMRVEATTP